LLIYRFSKIDFTGEEIVTISVAANDSVRSTQEIKSMKVWSKPQVREQEVGLEVTSYLPAEIDII